jgi:hypothetical protein
LSNRNRVEPVQIDVGRLVRLTVATLYSHLVTRPTGQAVRVAIESQLAEAGDTSCSLIDFSEVSVLDFSCADEVVAKLLARYLHDDRPREAYFVLRGVVERHREPIEAVLDRHGLAAVAENGRRCELLGRWSGMEGRVWETVEERGRLASSALPQIFPEADQREALHGLVRRRLVFLSTQGDVHALSQLVGDLLPG